MTRAPLFEMAFAYASGLDAGVVRAVNEDRVVCCPEEGFFAVIDGMGGLAEGEQTAEFLERMLPSEIRRLADSLPEHYSVEQAAGELVSLICELSDYLYEQTNRRGSVRFGAALCAAWLVRRCVILVHLGDCRAYWMRRFSDTVYCLTDDQNLVALLIAAGVQPSSEAAARASGSRLTRFVGMRPPCAPKMTCRRLNEGDRLLLCSDGLYRDVSREEMALIQRGSGSLKEKCDCLIRLANERGGRDNISVVLVSCSAEEQDLP